MFPNLNKQATKSNLEAELHIYTSKTWCADASSDKEGTGFWKALTLPPYFCSGLYAQTAQDSPAAFHSAGGTRTCGKEEIE